MLVHKKAHGHLHAESRLSLASLVGLITLGCIAAAGAAAWMAYPSARVTTSSSRGLAGVSLRGVDAHIQSAAYIADGHSVPLTDRRGTLVPATKLPAGTSGTITVNVTGPAVFRWLPWGTRRVEFSGSTPAAPKTKQTTIGRPLGSGLTVAFNEPVVAVQYRVPGQKTQTLTLRSPRSSVTLPLAADYPNQHGTVSVAAKVRPWESISAPTQIQWSTVPYVTVEQTSSTTQPAGPLTITFSQPIKNANTAHWKILPDVAGQWKQISPTQFSFTTYGPTGFGPESRIQLTIPGGSQGPQANSGSALKTSAQFQWTTPPGSILRLQQLLAQEGYLPVSWSPKTPVKKPTLGQEDATIYNPPAGTFHWQFPNLPSALKPLWVPGQMTVMTKGAIMQFEAVNQLPVDGIAGPKVWGALINDRLKGATNPAPYTYISVTQQQPETLELWAGNKMKLKTKTNTGIKVRPTYLGTFPIFERLKFQIMKGKEPNGKRYADPVYWIDYFKGSDAVHGFKRAAYGFPQSLGCVEVPPKVSKKIYKTVNYGTLVTVNPQGVKPAPASPGKS